MRRWQLVIGLIVALVGIWFTLNRLALAIQPPLIPEGQYGSWQAAAIQSDFRLLEMASPTSGWAVATRRGDSTWPNQSLVFEFADGKWNWKQTLEGPAVAQMVMVSPTDGWLVANDQSVGTLGTGRAYHYTGDKWNPVIAPEDVFLGIDMISSGEGFVLGAGRLWRLYNGATSWQRVGAGVYDYPFNNRTFSAFQVISPQDMWYLSSPLYDWTENVTQPILYHYNGVNWRKSFAHPDLRAFTMANYHDGWLVGNNGKIWRYNGIEWMPVASPTTADLKSVSLAGANEAWALSPSGTALHFAGSAWQEVQLPVANGQIISMLGSDDGWIAGSNAWMRYSGGSWQEFANDVKPILGAPAYTYDAAMLADHSVWTGSHYFDGYRWQPHTYSLDDSLFAGVGPFMYKMAFGINGLAMASPSEGWAIGPAVAFTGTNSLGFFTDNLLYAFDGNQWTAQETPATAKGSTLQRISGVNADGRLTTTSLADLRQKSATVFGWLTDVDLVAPADLWFATSTGYVLRYVGGQWSTSRDAAIQDGGTSTTSLSALDMLSPQAGWAVGNKIVHFNGQQWITSQSVSDTLYAIDMVSPTLGMAVGNNGAIMRYDGSVWQAVPSPTHANLTDIQMLAPDEGWAVGSQQGRWNGFEQTPNSGVILYWDGKNWQVDGYLPYDRLAAIVMLDSERGYVFGDSMVLTLSGEPNRDHGSVTGQVTVEGRSSLSGIMVYAYRNAGNWYAAAVAQTGEDGSFTLESVPVGVYRLFFFDPKGVYRSEFYNSQPTLVGADDVNVTAGATTGNIDAMLEAFPPPQISVEGNFATTTDPQTGQVTVLSGRAPTTATFVRDATCSGGVAPTAVTFVIGGKEFPMQQQGDGVFQVTLNIPADLPNSAGPYAMSVRYNCNTPQNIPVGSFAFYDPSGQITDGQGQPVAGAIVNLYRVVGGLPDTAGVTGDCRTVETRPGGTSGDWSSLPAADINLGAWVNPEVEQTKQQPSISPVVNPQLTGSDGRYGWDVVEGCWFVTVSAPGYEGNISPVVGVPPEVTDLDLEIQLTESKIFLPSVQK